jgi:hypothetical protein
MEAIHSFEMMANFYKLYGITNNLEESTLQYILTLILLTHWTQMKGSVTDERFCT